MDKFYVTLVIDAENQHEADGVAEAISDDVGAPLMSVYPGYDAQLDNDGQVVIYTGYIHPSHGA